MNDAEWLDEVIEHWKTVPNSEQFVYGLEHLAAHLKEQRLKLDESEKKLSEYSTQYSHTLNGMLAARADRDAALLRLGSAVDLLRRAGHCLGYGNIRDEVDAFLGTAVERPVDYTMERMRLALDTAKELFQQYPEAKTIGDLRRILRESE